MKYLTVIFLILSGGMIPTGFAQADGSIIGQVFDLTTRLPIPRATIHIQGTSRYTTTDSVGMFSINDILAGEYDIKISHVAYSPMIRHLSIGEQTMAQIVIHLEPATISIKGGRVTATRTVKDEFSTPTSISITPREKFAERNFSTTAEVMREEPGILVQKTTHGHGAPILRGLIGKHVLLLYDGIRLNKPTFRFGANQYLNTVDLESLARIEVTRGPSSVTYGSDAIGGTINLIPPVHANREEKPHIKPYFTSRYSTADGGRSIHGALTGNCRHFTASAGGTYKKIGDLRGGGTVGKQTPTGWDENSFFARINSRLGSNSALRIDYLGVRQHEVPRYDKYGCGDFQTYIYDPQDRDLLALTLDTKVPGSAFHSLKTSFAYQREVEGIIQQKTGTTTETMSMNRISDCGGYLQFSTLLDRQHWFDLGCEYYYDRINSKRSEKDQAGVTAVRPTFPDGSVYHSAGLYAQDEYMLSAALSLTLGFRYSLCVMQSSLEEPFGEFDETYRDLTGSLAIDYGLDSTFNFIGRWSRGFRAPNFNDAVVLKYSGSGVDAPSPGLKPEHSNTCEIGAKLNSRYVNGSLFCFYNQLGDLIDRVPGTYHGKTFFDENNNGVKDPTEYDIYQRRNVDRSRIYGFELENHVAILPQWEIRMNCFWTWGENQTDHEPLSRIPPLMGMLAFRWHPAAWSWFEIYSRLAGDQRRLSTRDRDDARIDKDGTPGWGTLNFRFQCAVSLATFHLNVENILDAAYKEHGSGIYTPGRNLMLGLSYGDL